MLNMAEKVVLLSLENESGKFKSNANYLLRYGLLAALLFEQVKNKKIQLQGKEIVFIDESSSGDKIQDVLYKMVKDINDLDLYVRVTVIAAHAISKEIINSLINARIVRDECKKFLGFIPVDRYPIINEFEKRKVETEIRDVLIDEKTDDYSSVFLSSIVVVCNAESLILSKEEIQEFSSKLQLIMKGEYFRDDELLPSVVKAIFNAIEEERYKERRRS